jgi:glutamine synthetase
MKSTDLRVKPGVSSRLDFPLFPPRTALLIIDVQDHLSSSSPDIATSEPSSHYLFDTALPNAIPKMAKLANTMRDIRDNTVTTGTMFASETNGCEVIITYLEACTIDCRDISLDYKLSGPKLTKLPNPSNKATFETLPMDLQPCLVGRGDILIPKTSCSVFQSTNIRYILSNLGIRQLVICGQLTDQCVMSAVRDAADLGFLVSVVEDACAALSKEEHERGLLGMKGFARILSTEKVLDELNSHRASNQSDTLSESSNVDYLQTVEAKTSQNEKNCSVERLEVSAWKYCVDSQLVGATNVLLNILKHASVEFLRFASVDISNNIRAKAVPIKRLIKDKDECAVSVHPVLDNQVSIAKVCMAGMPSYNDVVIPGSGISAKDVLMIKPDLNSLKILPYSPKSAMVFGTMHDQRTGELSPLCSRGLLSRVIETANEKFGIGFTIGIELEFCLIKADSPEELVPIDTSLFGGTTTLNDQQDFINDLYAHLEKQNIEVEVIHSESAPGQMEVVLAYDFSAINLADNVVHAKETIKCCAKQNGMISIFAPKVYGTKAGNGMHVHLSLRDESSSDPLRNVFQGEAPFSISEIGQSFLEGILCHLEGLLSLTMPSKNSFLRVGQGCWTGHVVGWEVEDKESPLRVCVNSRNCRATNVEMKLMDNTCNIYLALASILWAGLNGIKQKMALRKIISQMDNIKALPKSLEESLDCLERDCVLRDLLGEELFNAYIAVKCAEIEHSKNSSLTMTQAILTDITT